MPRTVALVCEGCSTEYTAEYRRRHRARFCSHPCAMKHVGREAKAAGRFRGDKNPYWKGGIATDNVRYRDRFRKRWPIKADAHDKVTRALSSGKLQRQPCEICGAKGAAHHDDYAKPLSVRWLCKPHHTEWHQGHKAVNGGEPQLAYIRSKKPPGAKRTPKPQPRQDPSPGAWRSVVRERADLRAAGINPDAQKDTP